MFYASVGKENPDGGERPDVFAYYLADRLGVTLATIRAMPADELLGWVSYHRVRSQQEELGMKRASRG